MVGGGGITVGVSYLYQNHHRLRRGGHGCQQQFLIYITTITDGGGGMAWMPAAVSYFYQNHHRLVGEGWIQAAVSYVYQNHHRMVRGGGWIPGAVSYLYQNHHRFGETDEYQQQFLIYITTITDWGGGGGAWMPAAVSYFIKTIIDRWGGGGE